MKAISVFVTEKDLRDNSNLKKKPNWINLTGFFKQWDNILNRLKTMLWKSI